MKIKFSFKKIWAVILTLCMFISLASSTVLAADFSDSFKNHAKSNYLHDTKFQQGISKVEVEKTADGYNYKIYCRIY